MLQHHAWDGGELRAAAAGGAAGRASPVLAYVTPWNGAGYDLAKKHRCRLDFVAPVWYQLRHASGELQLTGGHDADDGWAAAVRAPCEGSNHVARVVPRVIFELAGQDALAAFRQPDAVARLLAEEARRHAFDGWVFEGWSLWAAMGVTRHPELRAAALGLLRALHDELAPAARRLLLAVSPLVPAPGRPPQLTAADVAALLPLADALSVMTYDYAQPRQHGPNAPLPWVLANADAFAAEADRLPGAPRHKVLLGLNFYGYEFVLKGSAVQSADAVLAARLLEVLRQQGVAAGPAGTCGAGGEAGEAEGAAQGGGGGGCAAGEGGLRVQWLDESREHLFRWRDAPGSGGGGGGARGKRRTGALHLLYFPTPAALAERLAAAAARGMGASVWELGQGAEAFCALL